ncbi:hypothetical protein AB0K02_24255 [Streptomyces sp. NPDC049597]|uniref:hypothetical protein n=1 Tax=Streptomyces sp. NPDC049597 TaxID=3155276 RepID=UPI00343DA10D
MGAAGTIGGLTVSRYNQRSAYEMLPISTGASRAEALALAQEAALRLAEQHIDHPTSQLVGLIRSQADMLGLYEDGALVGCIVVPPEPEMRHWGAEGRAPGLLVSLVPPVPGENTLGGRLLTLWLADRAARSGLEWVWWEIPAPADATSEASTSLTDTLQDLGWEYLPPVRRADGERVARLRLRAEARNAPAVAISAPDTALRMLAVSGR